MIAIGKRYKPLLEKRLEELHISVLWLPDNPDLDPRLAGHADLNLYREKDSVWVAEGIASHIVSNLTEAGYIVFPVKGICAEYPGDAPLCVCPVGDTLICNTGTAEPGILAQTDKKICSVRQGYTRCSVCIVSDSAIITSDKAIANTAEQNGSDVLLITPGYIQLEGFDYGFIGGAAFQTDNNRIALTGQLREHPDEAAILEFMRSHGVTPVYLTDLPIFDIGGGIALP